MGRPRNPSVPEDGYISKRQFDQTGSIATEDFAVVADLDNTKKLILDPTANDTTIKATLKTPHLTVDTVYTLPLTGGTLVTTASTGPSFGIVQPDHGTSPTATVPADTLTLTSSDASILITGNSSTKTVDIKATAAGSVTNVTATSPLFSSGGTTPNITIQNADATHTGALTSSDWSTFNNKQDRVTQNYITNSDAEIDTSDWNLYNDSGNTVSAYLINQDLTFTSALSGAGGNGVDIEYIYNAGFSAATPNINVISSSHVQVQWNNGPTIANNPTATQLKAAWDAVGAATAIATVAITGTASKLQYITGQEFLGNGGDTAPVNGTGGVTAGVTFTRNTSTPLIGIASFDLGKDAANRQGQGVSTDFTINSIDKDSILQVSFIYQGSSGMTLGTSSDVKVFIYDISNATLIPVTPLATLAGPVSTPKQYSGLFNTTTSSNYRLIIHISTTSATAWDLLLDSVIVTDSLDPTAATEVPSVVLQSQPISGAVTDHMCVMWRDGATQWVPATIAGAALPVFGTDITQLGFATNIVGSEADIYIRGAMAGFSFGPFTGYEQYIDNTAGGISPLPSPFTDLYVMVGMAISSTVLNIQFDAHVDLISNGSGVPVKGGLLTSTAVNDGTGDVVLSPGANGTFLVANSAVARGLNYRVLASADIPNNAANTTGSAAKWTTARNLAGNSVDGSANVAFANKFVVQGTTDAGLSAAQFLGALGTGIVKNTTTTGVLSIAVAGDFPTLNQNTTGSAATWTTARNLAGNSVNGSANVAFSNKFIVQGTTDAGLSGAQFLGALATGLVKNTTTTGVLSAAAASDVTGQLLTGYTLTIGGGTVAATDSILQGIQKLVGQPQVKTGTNGKIGTAVLVGGTVTVSNTSVTANSRIFLTSNVDGGTPGWLRVSAKTNATSFVITSSSILDTSTVAWIIVESIP